MNTAKTRTYTRHEVLFWSGSDSA